MPAFHLPDKPVEALKKGRFEASLRVAVGWRWRWRGSRWGEESLDNAVDEVCHVDSRAQSAEATRHQDAVDDAGGFLARADQIFWTARGADACVGLNVVVIGVPRDELLGPVLDELLPADQGANSSRPSASGEPLAHCLPLRQNVAAQCSTEGCSTEDVVSAAFEGGVAGVGLLLLSLQAKGFVD
ncbi:hypothetical protein Efla_001507 [Eimeria flavescens]